MPKQKFQKRTGYSSNTAHSSIYFTTICLSKQATTSHWAWQHMAGHSACI